MSLDIPSVINVTDETEPVLLRLVPALAGLGPRALAILADIAERLQRGARQYGGDFDDKPRDWDQETFEELADGLVYSTMRLMQLRERRAADEARQKAAVRLDDFTLSQLARRCPALVVGGVPCMKPQPCPDHEYSSYLDRFVDRRPPDGSGCG
jgi:hypothetical protein